MTTTLSRSIIPGLDDIVGLKDNKDNEIVDLFELWFPIAYQYGLTQEEFWDTNPRILKVYESFRNFQKGF